MYIVSGQCRFGTIKNRSVFQRKRDVSTSISSVKAEQIADVSASDFRQALAGKMPGVQVTQPSGDPEGSVSIRVRGISTVNAGSDPLYIIDGVPVERGFANLNNNHIPKSCIVPIAFWHYFCIPEKAHDGSHTILQPYIFQAHSYLFSFTNTNLSN